MSKLIINPCSNLDQKYNYLSDAMDSSGNYSYNPDDYKYCDDSKINCSVKATIRGQCYKDPDSYSEKLYEDFAKLTKLKINKQSKYIYLSDDSFVNYTTDYIGPSRYWMRAAGISEKETGEFLLITRTIGGHMIWPSKRKYVNVNGYEDVTTINMARGGEYGVYDRIDFTLKEIMNYFLNKGFSYSARLYKAIENEKDFFAQYGTGINGYKNFIDAFMLNGFVDGKTYEPLSLVTADFENGIYKLIEDNEKARDILEKVNAAKYIKNNNYCIMRRSERICQEIKKMNIQRIKRCMSL